MKNESKMFLKQSAYHVSKAKDLSSALKKSKGVDEALNKLKDIKTKYQKEALLAANRTIAKNYGFSSLKKLVNFMSKLAELSSDKKLQVEKIVSPNLVKNQKSVQSESTHHNPITVQPLNHDSEQDSTNENK